MKVTSELNLTSFNFWSGAESHEFTNQELEELGAVLEDIYPNGMTETQINDLVWFEEETICDWLDINYKDYLER